MDGAATYSMWKIFVYFSVFSDFCTQLQENSDFMTLYLCPRLDISVGDTPISKMADDKTLTVHWAKIKWSIFQSHYISSLYDRELLISCSIDPEGWRTVCECPL